MNDASIFCDAWNLRIDNDHDNYIMVFLGDLGILPEKEQEYWKSFNISPIGKKISETAFQRNIMGEFCNPKSLDLEFKNLYDHDIKKWTEKYGWPLFRNLSPSDEHHLKTLRLLLIDSQTEFDAQIGSLTKILIDYLNECDIEKNISCEIPEKTQGIGKLELFLKNKCYNGYEKHIGFLRNLQSIRSSGVAHSKGKKYDDIIRKLGFQNKTLKESFNSIIEQAIDFLKWLLAESNLCHN